MTPARTITPQAWMTAPGARAVMAALDRDGAARFVGGCVRDAVLDRAPDGDVDVATTLTPDAVMAALAADGIKAVPTGLKHGTVTAVTADAHYEITTLRRDVRTYGRHADVAFTDDWREDAARRDFTINAMSMTEAGEIFDYFGGLDDLAAGRVRFVGDAETRIREDVLRVLRFFRFHARYGRSAPDPAALAAAARLAELVPGLSAERVWAELSRILTGPRPTRSLGLMAETGVLSRLLPEAGALARLTALVVIEAGQGLEADAVRRLAAALDGDAAVARDVSGRLRLSRHEAARLEDMMSGDARIAPECTAAEARREIYRSGMARWRDRLLLSWATAKADSGAADTDYGRLLGVGVDFTPPVFPLSGADAKAAGLEPGPAMGRALRAVEDWWIAEEFRPGRDACLARLRKAVAAPD